MHLIIGSLLSLLLSKKPGKSKSGAFGLSYKGVIEVKHSLPGRIRYYIPKLTRIKLDTGKLKKQLLSIDGINKIEFNPISGSVLVFYDESGIEPFFIFAALVKLFQLEAELEKPTKSMVGKEIFDISSSLNRATYEYTRGLLDLKTMVPLLFIGSALFQFFIKRTRVFPGSMTLLWWAYAMLSKQDK